MSFKQTLTRAFSTKETPAPKEEPQGLLNSVKGVLRSTTFNPNSGITKDFETADTDTEEKGLLSKYSQKLKHSLTTAAIITKSKSMVQGAQESVQTSINFTKYLPYIIILCLGGAFFLFLAFFFLPLILIFPQKFSFSFALGCMCFMGAIALVRDPMTFLKSLLQKDKIMFTGGYVVSLIGTFYFSLYASSRIFALLFAGAQIVSLLWLIGSSIPGGRKAVGTLQNMVVKCCKSVTKKLLGSSGGSGSSGNRSFLPI